MAVYSREFILGVIEKYKDNPCLWQSTDNDYHNKIKRNLALENILADFKTVDPGANRDTVTKKLASMRNAFNKENRKNEEVVDDLNESASVNSVRSSTSSNSRLSFKRPRSKADQVLEQISKRIEEARVERTKQPHDAFGEYVGEKLRSMPASMVPFCQKIINDALFYAETNNLNVTSRIVTDIIVQPNRDPTYRPPCDQNHQTSSHPVYQPNPDLVYQAYVDAIDTSNINQHEC